MPRRCAVDNSSAPPWFDDVEAVQRNAMEKAKRFQQSVLDPSDVSIRPYIGGQAVRLLKRAFVLLDKVPEYDTTRLLGSLNQAAQMCGWRKTALRYVRKLIALPTCDLECYCMNAGSIVSMLRTLEGESAAERFFRSNVAKPRRCPYWTSMQMPVPTTSFASWLEYKPFWDFTDFATGRLLHDHRHALLRELRPFARRRVGLWRTMEAGGPKQQDAELVESG